MKRIIPLLLVLAALLSLVPSFALADRPYVLPDSDDRRLTWEEVAEWDYESLGYAFNEIFARYGYDFEPGGEYANYFNHQPWYRPNGTYDNQRDVYPYVREIEWYNYDLIKEVRAYKQRYGDSGLSIWDNFSTGFDTLQGFRYVELQSRQSFPVYSAPSSSSWRGANGKAEISTNGAVYMAGWEGDWLLVMYELNSGSVRVGYIDSRKVKGNIPMSTMLQFAYDPATTLERCTLTDDPASSGRSITTLNAGVQVTWLTRFYNNYAWDYVEARYDGKVVRGFIRAGNLDIQRSPDPLENMPRN